MNNESKSGVAADLRKHAEEGSPQFVIAAIEGLGELGGMDAVKHLEELFVTYAETNNNDKWAALLRAYGRAARYLPN